MKANELWIGNIINRDGKETKVKDDTPLYFYEADKYTPIKLISKWLERMGFERDLKLEELDHHRLKEYKYGDQTTNNFIRICWHETGGYTTSYNGAPLTKPKYMHQL